MRTSHYTLFLFIMTHGTMYASALPIMEEMSTDKIERSFFDFFTAPVNLDAISADAPDANGESVVTGRGFESMHLAELLCVTSGRTNCT